jgi:uncharacterized membrane protein
MDSALDTHTRQQQGLREDFRNTTEGSGARALRDAPRGDHYQPQSSNGSSFEGLASFLGWFSIGLGVAEIVAPGTVARMIGVPSNRRTRNTLQSMGARELLSGVGILANRQQANWLWSRVAGDAIDLSLLGAAMNSDRNNRGRTAAATAAVLGVTALDVYCATQLSSRDESRRRHPGSTGDAELVPERGAPMLRERSGVRRAWHSVTVNKPIAEVYAFWRSLENLPRFMHHLESVEILDSRRSHWKAKAPAGASVEWDAEIIDERENELISWRSLPGATVPNAGTVRFKGAPGNRGTEVHVVMEYHIPGGALGAVVARLFREEPKQQVHDDLLRFKQVMETGEVVKSDASIHKGMHPAQPAS